MREALQAISDCVEVVFRLTITCPAWRVQPLDRAAMEQQKRAQDQQLRSEMASLASLRDEVATIQSDLDIQVSSNAVTEAAC